MTPLAAHPWPTWAPVRPGCEDRWRAALGALRARATVVAFGQVQVEAVAAWAAAVREAGRVGVLQVPAEQLSATLLCAVDGAPLVVGLSHTAATTRGDWRRALARLAGCRSPWLRAAALHMPACAAPQWAALGDVRIAWPAERPAHDARCLRCPAVDRCPGPGSGRFGPRPLRAPTSNQFDLQAAPAGANAVVRVHGEPPLIAVTGSVPAAALARALRKGQLYRDRSDRALLNDFAAQLQPLQRNRLGVWQPRAEAPFAAEEARLVQRIGRLRGLVVDIGAGPLRYVAALNAALDRGELRYVAVEPDSDHLRAGQQAVPRGVFVRGVGEALPLRSGCADAVLMLRSWNHLRDVGAAVREATRVVRPGGLLIAVDNELFGLVRSPEQLARARAIDRDRAPFEHYRNAGLAEAWAAIVRSAPGHWRQIEAWPVGPDTSNQWQLVAERLQG